MNRRLPLVLVAVAALVMLVLMRRASEHGAPPPRAVDAGRAVSSAPEGRAGSARPPLRLSNGKLDEGRGRSGLDGRVLSTRTQQPIAGATLVFGAGGAVFETRTDAHGAFAWTVETPGTYELTSLAAPGYIAFEPGLDESPLVVVVRPGVRVSDVTLYLTPVDAAPARADLGSARHESGDAKVDRSDLGDAELATIFGQVRDDKTTKPIVSFSIIASVRRGALQRGIERQRSFFSADGNYRVSGLHPGPLCVVALAYGRAPSKEQCVEVSAGGEVRVDFALGRGVTVRGRVIDRADRRPLAGARVSFEAALGAADGLPLPVIASTETGADGGFELGGLEPGVRSIVVAAEGHHSRVIPGLRIEEDRAPPPIEVDLLPTKPGEAPSIESAGINAAVRADGDTLVLDAVTAEGGAGQAGLQKGDVIVKVDGQDIASYASLQKAVEALRGPEGSTVTVTFRRPPSDATTDVVVTRRRVVNR